MIFLSPSINSPPFYFSSVNSELPFMLTKLWLSLFSLNKNITPCLDNIDHYIVRSYFQSNSTFSLNMYNKSFSLSYFLLSWKLGKIVFFKKKRRSNSNVNSYWSITLLPIFGKIF